MKAAGIAFAAGALGVLLGSLAAQGPGEFGHAPEGANGAGEPGLIYEGKVEAFSYRTRTGDGREYPVTVEAGAAARVYPGWVYLPERRLFVSADAAGTLSFREGGRRDAARDRGEFGDDPEPGRPGRPDTFRAD